LACAPVPRFRAINSSLQLIRFPLDYEPYDQQTAVPFNGFPFSDFTQPAHSPRQTTAGGFRQSVINTAILFKGSRKK
jgi:hypothetical protein